MYYSIYIYIYIYNNFQLLKKNFTSDSSKTRYLIEHFPKNPPITLHRFLLSRRSTSFPIRFRDLLRSIHIHAIFWKKKNYKNEEIIEQSIPRCSFIVSREED